MLELIIGHKTMRNDDFEDYEEVFIDDLSVKEIVKTKQKDDPSFDDYFNVAINNCFFSPELTIDMITEFDDIAYNLSSLHRYYEYSRRYFDAYIMDQKASLAENDNGTAEYMDYMGDLLLGDEQDLPDENKYSVIVMLCSLFEKGLRSLVKHICEENKISYFSDDYDGSTFLRYIKFLRIKYRMNIYFDNAVFEKYRLICLIRNYFIHEGDFDSSDRISVIYKRNPELVKNGRILLTNEYIIDCFETIGRMFKTIELAYLERNGQI